MPADLMSEAQDALTRLDHGTSLPTDHQLAAAYERHCQQQWDAIALDRANRDYDTWLTGQCWMCGPDGASGDPCDRCYAASDLAMRELELAA